MWQEKKTINETYLKKSFEKKNRKKFRKKILKNLKFQKIKKLSKNIKSHQKLSKSYQKLSKLIKSNQKLSLISNRPKHSPKPSKTHPITFPKMFENRPKITKSAGNYEISQKLPKLTDRKWKVIKKLSKVIKKLSKDIKRYQK